MSQKIILKPSTIAYDGMNSIGDVLNEYKAYLAFLKDNKDLKTEYQEVLGDYFSSPTILNVSKLRLAKQAMLERGLMVDELHTNQKSGTQMGE